jgi:hypothetical protein
VSATNDDHIEFAHTLSLGRRRRAVKGEGGMFHVERRFICRCKSAKKSHPVHSLFRFGRQPRQAP